jgi:hypothetical protein
LPALIWANSALRGNPLTAAYAAFNSARGSAPSSVSVRRRYPLAPRISAGKTIEGALGGFFADTAIGVLLAPLHGLDKTATALTSICLYVAALSGDFRASLPKRLNGVKDFGTLIPARGRVLDRFDSFLSRCFGLVARNPDSLRGPVNRSAPFVTDYMFPHLFAAK